MKRVADMDPNFMSRIVTIMKHGAFSISHLQSTTDQNEWSIISKTKKSVQSEEMDQDSAHSSLWLKKNCQ